MRATLEIYVNRNNEDPQTSHMQYAWCSYDIRSIRSLAVLQRKAHRRRKQRLDDRIKLA